MKTTVKQLAHLVQGTVVGDGDILIHGARTLKDAKAGEVTFVENEKYATHLKISQASAVVVPADFHPEGKVLIQVADPLMAFVAIFQHFDEIEKDKPSGIDPRAVLDSSVTVEEMPSIFPFVCIGAKTVIGKRCRLFNGVSIGKNCRLGDDVVLHPNVVLYDNTVVGDRVIIHANTVIGADGFGYRFQKGEHVKVPQLSNVIIGCDVEIGACCTIDRGTFEPTRIGDGTKIDNLVQVAHNCNIGKHNLLASMVGIGGSTSTGNYVTLAGQVGVADHLHLGDGVMAAAQSGIISSLAAGARVMGFPARPAHEKRRIYAIQEKLPEMRRNLLRINKILGLTRSAQESE